MIFELSHKQRSQIEYVHPENINQSSTLSVTTADGRYDMTQFSNHETTVVKTVLKNAWSGKYPNRARGIGLANEASPILYKPRYVLYEIIIQKYAASDNPLDVFAVATAYKTKGASGRKDAIRFYEKWLVSSSSAQRREATMYLFDAREPFFSYNLAELYQGENRLEEALKYATNAEILNKDHAPGFPLLIASIYKKMDISKCVKYLKKVCKSKAHSGNPIFFAELTKATELLEKGYQYKPRAFRPNKRDADFEASVEAAAKQFLEEWSI